jgi:hypothetical protein
MWPSCKQQCEGVETAQPVESLQKLDEDPFYVSTPMSRYLWVLTYRAHITTAFFKSLNYQGLE